MDQNQTNGIKRKLEIDPTEISSREDWHKFHVSACEAARIISIAKNTDYAGWEDPFQNFHDSGAYGILTRLGDKYKRLLNFEKRILVDPQYKMSVVDELTDDTALDAVNYSLLYMGYKRRRRLR